MPRSGGRASLSFALLLLAASAVGAAHVPGVAGGSASSQHRSRTLGLHGAQLQGSQAGASSEARGLAAVSRQLLLATSAWRAAAHATTPNDAVTAGDAAPGAAKVGRSTLRRAVARRLVALPSMAAPASTTATDFPSSPSRSSPVPATSTTSSASSRSYPGAPPPEQLVFYEGSGPAMLTPAKVPGPKKRKPVVKKPAKRPPAAKPPAPLPPAKPTPSTTLESRSSPGPDAKPQLLMPSEADERQAALPALSAPVPLRSPDVAMTAPPPSPAAGFGTALWSPLPPRWDSREKRLTGGVTAISRVRFQASCNACVAFTVIAAAETAYAIATRQPATLLDFSEQHLFFCNDDAASRPPNCEEGWVLGDALAVMTQRGVRHEKCFVYDVTRGSAVCQAQGQQQQDELPAQDELAGVDVLDEDASNQNQTQLQQERAAVVGSSVTEAGPVVAGAACGSVAGGSWEVIAHEWYGVEHANATTAKEVVRTTGSAMTCFKLYADMYWHPGGVYRWDGESAWLGYHCAQLVGWNDDAGYWLFKSSWGTEVADKGFYKIAYGEAEVLAWGVYGLIWRPDAK